MKPILICMLLVAIGFRWPKVVARLREQELTGEAHGKGAHQITLPVKASLVA
jgi:hypothetical protein